MAEITNELRAAWAQTALLAFMGETGQRDLDEAIPDLICNLLHLVKARGNEQSVKEAASGIGMFWQEHNEVPRVTVSVTVTEGPASWTF